MCHIQLVKSEIAKFQYNPLRPIPSIKATSSRSLSPSLEVVVSQSFQSHESG
jgi:hypothetical protein